MVRDDTLERSLASSQRHSGRGQSDEPVGAQPSRRHQRRYRHLVGDTDNGNIQRAFGHEPDQDIAVVDVLMHSDRVDRLAQGLVQCGEQCGGQAGEGGHPQQRGAGPGAHPIGQDLQVAQYVRGLLDEGRAGGGSPGAGGVPLEKPQLQATLKSGKAGRRRRLGNEQLSGSSADRAVTVDRDDQTQVIYRWREGHLLSL